MLALEVHPSTLSNLNIRIERHGDDRQLAADLKLTMNVAGVVLNDLEPGLHESLFRKPGSGEQQDLARDLTDLLVREDVYVTLIPPKAKAQTDDAALDAANDPDGAQDAAA